MIIKLKALVGAMSKLNEFAGIEKVKPGIMFKAGTDSISICYTVGSKRMFSEEVPAIIEESDCKEPTVFNYEALTKIVEACKPTGNIITDDVVFKFCDNNIVKVMAEKKIIKILTNEAGEQYAKEMVASVTEQSLAHAAPEAQMKTKVIGREPYDAMKHLTQAEIDEKYPNGGEDIPMEEVTWGLSADTWGIADLRKILSKLSNETGKTVYVSPKSGVAFVNNTGNTICIPLDFPIKNSIVTTTAIARSVSNILSKMATKTSSSSDDTEDEILEQTVITESTEDIDIFGNGLGDGAAEEATQAAPTETPAVEVVSDTSGIIDDSMGTVYVHVISGDTVVYSTEDNSVAFSLRNLPKNSADAQQIQRCTKNDYSHYMLNFNKEVLQSVIGAAKTVSASDKITVGFVTEEVDGESVTKMTMKATNTNSSSSNQYDITAERTIDADGTLASKKFSVALEQLYQAVARTETDTVAFDICEQADNSTVRIAEIKPSKVRKVAQENGVQGRWSEQFMMQHRSQVLGCTTYFTVNND